MAMSGKESPNLNMIREKATRGQIEFELGPPIKTTSLEDGRRMDVYDYEIGNQPSTGRAIGHGALDLITLGLWEIIGTPVEGFTGDKYQLTIIYDKNDRVISFKEPTPITLNPE